MAAASHGPEVAERFAEERPTYEALASALEGTLREALREARVYDADVTSRAKEVLSFAKKALRKGYVDPLNEIGDKAGVRVVVSYPDDVPRAEDVVGNLCEILKRESKLDALDYDELGYLGVHLDVVPRDAVIEAARPADVTGRRAEVQIHTRAQSAWAVASHELLYKSPLEVPGGLKRAITRLVALVELFDGEVERFRETMAAHPDFKEMQILGKLDDDLIRFSGRKPDLHLSALVVPAIMRLHGAPVEQVYADVIAPFIASEEDRLRGVYDRYADDHRANPLLFQPEALLIFERLEHDPDALREAWPVDALPIDLLESMAAIWGVDI